MHDMQLKYLRAINRQLCGPLRQAAGDGMSGRLLFCVGHLLSSLIAEQEIDPLPATSSMARVRARTPELQRLMGGNPRAREVLEELQRDHPQAKVQAIQAELAGLLVNSQQHDQQHLLVDLIDSEQRRWDNIEEHFNLASSSTQQQSDREVMPFTTEELQRLVVLLQQQCEEHPALQVSEVRAISGGFSKQTIMLTLTNNQHLPAQIVVRRDRAESPVGSTVLDEYQLLKTLHAAGISVPRPLAVDAGSVMGSPILIMEKAEGGNIGDVYNIHSPASVSSKLASNLAQELAGLHSIQLETLPAKTPGMDSGHKESLRREIEGFKRDWQALNECSLTIDVAFQWLFAHLDRLDETRCLVHRDVRFHNILSQGEQLTALLDWELATIGHPARDLGYAYHHIIQFCDWQQFLDAYAQAGGQVPDEHALDFYILWSDLFVAVYMYRARQSFLASNGENIQLAYAGERLRQHNMYLLSKRLKEVLRKYGTDG